MRCCLYSLLTPATPPTAPNAMQRIGFIISITVPNRRKISDRIIGSTEKSRPHSAPVLSPLRRRIAPAVLPQTKLPIDKASTAAAPAVLDAVSVNDKSSAAPALTKIAAAYPRISPAA